MTDEAEAGDVAQPARDEGDDDEGAASQGGEDEDPGAAPQASDDEGAAPQGGEDEDPGAAPQASDDEGAAPQASERPKKRKKKRKADAEAPPPRAGVPAFAQGFPAHPELDRLLDAFERGDFAAVRAGAARLAADAEGDDVRAAARELRRRIDPDPLAALLVVAAIALLAFLALWYWTHPYTAG